MAIQQMGLFGGPPAPPQNLSPQEKVAYILEQRPAARDDDRELMLAFWEIFDGLALVLGEEGAAKFAAWFARRRTRRPSAGAGPRSRSWAGEAGRCCHRPERRPAGGPWTGRGRRGEDGRTQREDRRERGS